MWDICLVCFWEDDGSDLHDLESNGSGCNGLTLRQGRDNFRQLGASHPRLIRYVCPEEERGKFKHVARAI